MKRVVLASMLAAGALSAQAAVLNFSGTFFPENATTTATGFASAAFDDFTNVLTLRVTYNGLSSAVAATHIHCCLASPISLPPPFPPAGNAGVASQVPRFASFPVTTSGVWTDSYDLDLASSWNAAFVTNNGGTTASATAALIAAMSNQRAYFNIHSASAPGGEIRAYYMQVPEPATYALVALAVLGLGVSRSSRSLRSKNSIPTA